MKKKNEDEQNLEVPGTRNTRTSVMPLMVMMMKIEEMSKIEMMPVVNITEETCVAPDRTEELTETPTSSAGCLSWWTGGWYDRHRTTMPVVSDKLCDIGTRPDEIGAEKIGKEKGSKRDPPSLTISLIIILT